MKKRSLSVMCAAVFSVSMLTACGSEEPQYYQEDDIEDDYYEDDYYEDDHYEEDPVEEDDAGISGSTNSKSQWDAEWVEDEDGWRTTGTIEYDLNDNFGGDFTGIWQSVDDEGITLTIKNLEDWEKKTYMTDTGIYKLVSDTKMELYDDFDWDEPLETLTMLPDGTIESDKDGVYTKIKDYDVYED